MASTTVIGTDPVERPRSRQPAYWIFLPLVLASLWYLHVTIPLAKAASWWTVGVPILVLIAGLTGPICRALGLRRAALICAVLILGFYWTLSFYLMIGITTAGPLGLIYFWYFFFSTPHCRHRNHHFFCPDRRPWLGSRVRRSRSSLRYRRHCFRSSVQGARGGLGEGFGSDRLTFRNTSTI